MLGMISRSCGTVVAISYAPPWGICGLEGHPVVCNHVWLKVQGPNLACWDGDSGGPLFSGSWLYGISKSADATGSGIGQCNYAVFMSRDFLADMNLSVLYLNN